MEALRELFADPEIRRASIAVGYVLAVLLVRTLGVRWVFRTKLSSDTKLRWRAQIRNATVIAILLGFTLIWAEQLRTLALSVVAIAAAIAITTKEISACFLGSFVRASGRSFEIGDRVQIGDVRGDVVDIGPMTTAILEVGVPGSIHARTGRVVTIPNSKFLNTDVFNETKGHAFVLHVVRIPLAKDDDWSGAEARLERLGQAACEEYFEDAATSMNRIALERGVPAPRIEPSVYIDPVEPGRVDLLLRIPVLARERDEIGQRITRQFLAGRDVLEASSPASTSASSPADTR